MDTATALTQAESDLRDIQALLGHPVVKSMLEDNVEQQRVALVALALEDITSTETLYSHIAMKGHLKALKRAASYFEEALESAQEKLKKAKQDAT